MATRVLKRDHFGAVLLVSGDEPRVARETRCARPGLRWLARAMARREAAALQRLRDVPGVPRLVAFDGNRLTRTYLSGEVMYEARPATREYFRAAARLLRHVHRCGITHNDLAKEANWLRLADGAPAIVDFQVAVFSRRRGKLFRILAREDLRHLCKHKRSYLPQALTARQKRLLGEPSLAARLWRALVKPPYRWLTRGLLGWKERRGPRERELP